jgi:3-hydroxyacyl-[acyl-carrier-protein] dehydratase
MPDPLAESPSGAPAAEVGGKLLFDLSGIDLSGCALDRRGLERYLPHRGVMMLLDALVWTSEDYTRCVGVKQVRHDEFWVPGHFPAKALFPGVLMVETAAQLACYAYNVRRPHPVLAAFMRIDDCVFRSSVSPGDTLHILCREVKWSMRRFISDVQGVVGDRIAFEAKLSGLSLGDAKLGE